MAIDMKQFTNDVMPNLKANDAYNRFWYRFLHEGKQYRGLIDLTKKDLSKRDRIMEAKNQFIAIKEKTQRGIEHDVTVEEMVFKYLDTLDEGQYKRNMQSFYEMYIKKPIGGKQIASIIPDHLQKIVDGIIKSGRAPKTAKQTISLLSPAFRIARANRVMQHNPCEDVHIKLPKTKKIVSNASDRLKLVYNVIMKLYANDPFYRAFFLFALQGRRRGEIFKLRVDDIVLDQDYYVIRDTKNGEDQKIHLPPHIKEAILEFMPKSGVLFRSRITGEQLTDVKRQVAKIKQQAGEWFSLHYTRNLIVSAMAEQGVDAIHLSGALGHNNPNTIIKYLSLNYQIGSRMASDMIESIEAE